MNQARQTEAKKVGKVVAPSMSNSRDLLRPLRIYATDEHGDKTIRGRWRFWRDRNLGHRAGRGGSKSAANKQSHRSFREKRSHSVQSLANADPLWL